MIHGSYSRTFPAMRIIRAVDAMQRQARKWQRLGLRIGFVPTMGYLHAGHLSLVERACRLVGDRGKVVISIYVNPTQFGAREDFSRYPRDFHRDVALCRKAGADVLFAPDTREMYPAPYSTYVQEESLSKSMEGRARPSHFRGVATVVAKLFHLVQPSLAVFGAKDYQQAAIVRRMVRDLNFPVKIVVAPTQREADGLAMSSRNKYLTTGQRRQAVALWRALQHARTAVRASFPRAAGSLKAQIKHLIEKEPAARVDYVAFFDPDTLETLENVRPGSHMALAVRVGKTRLIDNARL